MASDEGKKLSFKILGSVDPSINGPRLGRLSIRGRKDIQTPNFFALTSRGVTPHMTPDVIAANTQFGGVHMALEDFIEKAAKGAPPIMTCPGPSRLHKFTALPQSISTLIAPRRSPAVVSPAGNTNTGISIFTSTGFQFLTNNAYISYILTLKPDIAIALADLPYGTTPGTKRMAKMGDRTQCFLQSLLELLSSQSLNPETAIFAPILPLPFLSQSEYINHLADDMIYLNDDRSAAVSGLAFYDANLLPDIPATTTISKLPRLSLEEPSSPREILRQISLGMDIFTIPFVGFATDAGIALTFRFPGPLPSSSSDHEESGNSTNVLPLGLNLWSPTLSTSLSPLSPNCTCYTCTSHHCAYIQHLLSAKEMLGWTLIQIHNHHILSEFFSAIRESLAKGEERFEEDCKTFERCYESELPEKSGQGPRVRGYHYKSEGLEEGKRNKAAWGNLGDGDSVSGKDGGGALVPDGPAEKLEEKGFAEKMEVDS